MEKFKQVKKTINGKVYTAQYNGVSAALDAVDGSYIDDSSNISSRKYSEYILEHIIVDPKGLTLDDFGSTEELKAITQFGGKVLNGNFPEDEDEGRDKSKGKG